MNNIDIKKLFNGLQKEMELKLYNYRENISHPGTKGDASELNWINWLKVYLPKRYSVDSAFIIDCQGNVSEQIDVVIYDQQYSPFVFKNEQDSVIYIPAESVYAVFEVKQELSKEYIEYAGKKLQSVRSLKRTSIPISHAGGYYPAKSPNKILGGILTLSSTWNPSLGESFEKTIKKMTENKRIDLGCALQEGAFKVNYEKTEIIINKSTKEETLIFFFLKLLIELQKMATIPAMDINSYGSVLDSL